MKLINFWILIHVPGHDNYYYFTCPVGHASWQSNLPNNCPNVLHAYIWHASFVNTLARSYRVVDIFNSPKRNLIALGCRAGVLLRPDICSFKTWLTSHLPLIMLLYIIYSQAGVWRVLAQILVELKEYQEKLMMTTILIGFYSNYWRPFCYSPCIHVWKASLKLEWD